MKTLKDLEPLGKFRRNMRMEQSVCKNCVLPQKMRVNRKKGKVEKTRPNDNFYHTKPFPYRTGY